LFFLRLRGKLLKQNQEFLRVYRAGKSVAGRYTVLYFLAGRDTTTRVGISVSKKVGNSVVRHRIKRLYKESFRQNYEKIRPGYDLVVVARRKAVSLNFSRCQEDFLTMLARAGLTSSAEQGSG
jgi:ribonuclease P protein component